MPLDPHVEDTQPYAFVDHRTDPPQVDASRPQRSIRRRGSLLLLAFFGALLILLLFPGRNNVLIIGLDRAPEGTTIARSDTLILMTYRPHRPYAATLSIPRDLWVEIPGVGYNRINTAHFFAEGERSGSGPGAAMAAVEHNFGVEVHDYVSVQFTGLVRFIDALGGLPITLENPVGKLPAGDHTLSGEQALAFVRDRSGTDDFFRMQQGSMFVQAVLRRMLKPAAWPRIPAAVFELRRSMQSSLNILEWLRLTFTLVRVGPEGLDSHQISREMTNAFVTQEGAQVLAPDWPLIQALVTDLFQTP
ncbi:MAG: LCP family protein [Anaerolineales bacterium]|nr:LCP family protein [Anaerolineales bacterium]